MHLHRRGNIAFIRRPGEKRGARAKFRRREKLKKNGEESGGSGNTREPLVNLLFLPVTLRNTGID